MTDVEIDVSPRTDFATGKLPPPGTVSGRARLRMYSCDACDRVCIGTGRHAFCPHCREKIERDDEIL